MGFDPAALQRATQLTREGRLLDATRAIQEALGGGFTADTWHPAAPPMRPAGEDITDVDYREVSRVPQIATRAAPASARAAREASFTAHVFAFGGHRWRYRLYEPRRADPAALLPVVVMLHGCKQDSEDFARGTGMNAVAEREGFLVVYPEQLRKCNQMGCWNWFEARHQRRGDGEPAMIAALAQAVVAGHGGDPRRVYVAGLSAGGAMAAIVGELYPDVFAAVGVHSGLPAGSASDVPSAFSAMRKGPGPHAVAGRRAVAIPTIVFHGSSDKTVAPGNGQAIVQQQLAAHAAGGTWLEREEAAPGQAQRTVTREQWLDGQGQVRLESWRIAGGPHAWAGGHPSGSFTDPHGPAASEAMARFFLKHARS
jgi:poly(hydroxyalkanoate) depolymerase family esterase